MQTKESVIQLRVDATQKMAYGIAANFAGMSMSSWLRKLADQAIRGAGRVDIPECQQAPLSWQEEYIEADTANKRWTATPPPTS